MKLEGLLITVCFHNCAPCAWLNFVVFNKLYQNKELFSTGVVRDAVYTFSKVNLWAVASIFILSPSANWPAKSSVARGFSSRCWIVRFSGLAP